MNDTDLDRLLVDAGQQWRAEHHDPAHVDWSAFAPAPTRRMTWFALSFVAAATAAVLVLPLLFTNHERPSVPPSPGVSPTPTPTSEAMRGAPRWFYALSQGRVAQIDATTGRRIGAVGLTGHPAGLVGAAPAGGDAYFATAMPGCQVRIVRYHAVGSPQGTYDVATVAGGLPRDGGQFAGIAVSRDGSELALPVTVCGNPNSEDIVVVDVASGAVRRWHGTSNDVSYVSSMQWSPDARQLAFVWTPCCGGGTNGTHLLDLSTPVTTSYTQTPEVLPQYPQHNDGYPYGPVFWWGHRRAVFVAGTIRALRPICRSPQQDCVAGGWVPGRVLARDLPKHVASVSSDRTGQHLLLAVDNGTRPSAVSRYDRGVLTQIPGRWLQPAW